MSAEQDNGKKSLQPGIVDLKLPYQDLLKDPTASNRYLEDMFAAQLVLAENIKEALIIRVQTDPELHAQFAQYRFGQGKQERPDLGSEALNRNFTFVLGLWLEHNSVARQLYQQFEALSDTET